MRLCLLAAASMPARPSAEDRRRTSNGPADDSPANGLLEAARWAPSANNSQPWRFLVTHHGEQSFARLLGTLAPGNRSWADAASALVLVATQTVDDTGRPRPRALFDTGQAVAALSVQAEADGLSVHQMGGIDAESTRYEFELDAAMTPLVVIAVSRRDPDAELPEPFAARERAPRIRLPLDSILLTAPEEPASRVA